MAEPGQSAELRRPATRVRAAGRAADGRYLGTTAVRPPRVIVARVHARTARSQEPTRGAHEQAESSSAQGVRGIPSPSRASAGCWRTQRGERRGALADGRGFRRSRVAGSRLASRADVTCLARQLHRTEDKLERSLQEVEQPAPTSSDAGDRPRRSNGRRTPGADRACEGAALSALGQDRTLPVHALEFSERPADHRRCGGRCHALTWSLDIAARPCTAHRSRTGEYPVPLLLVFALINRPEIFDLRPGGSFIEYLLGED